MSVGSAAIETPPVDRPDVRLELPGPRDGAWGGHGGGRGGHGGGGGGHGGGRGGHGGGRDLMGVACPDHGLWRKVSVGVTRQCALREARQNVQKKLFC